MNDENVNDLPPGWARTRLFSIVEPRTGKADPNATPDLPFIGMEQVEPHSMRLIGTVPSGTMKSAANTFQPYDVLYGRMRAYLNKVVQPDFSGLCSGEFIVLPETCAAHGRFLKYRLNASDFVRFANHLNSGDRPRVDFDQIKVFNLLLPPEPEQKRISDKLDELLSELDAGVAALERVRAKLKLYRAAVLKAAVEGTLTAEWRKSNPDTEPASALLTRILAERRRRWEESQLEKFERTGKTPPKDWKAKYKEPVKPNLSSKPSFPENWCLVTVDHLLAASLVNGISVRGTDHPPGIPALRLNAMSDRGFDYTLKRYLPLDPIDVDDLWIKENDFFVSRGNGSKHLVGRGTFAQRPTERIIFPDTMIRLRLLQDCLASRWISTVWGSGFVRMQVERIAKTTAGIYKISQPDLARVQVPMPPLAEQAAIIEAVEAQLSVIDHLEADLEAKVKSAQALRQSILRDAFAGKLVPQDPNDEPATELLKRIAAERAERARLAKAAKQAKPKAKLSPRRAAASR